MDYAFIVPLIMLVSFLTTILLLLISHPTIAVPVAKALRPIRSSSGKTIAYTLSGYLFIMFIFSGV